MFETTTCLSPSIVGMHVNDALKITSKHSLNLRLLSQKEDNDIPTGTIISQTPRPGKKMKAHQPLYIVVSKQIRMQTAPVLIGKTYQEIEKMCHKHELSCTHYAIPSIDSSNRCFAQIPRAQMPMTDNVLISYRGTDNKGAVIFPYLKGSKLCDVKQFLEDHGCRISCKSPPTIPDTQLIVTDQRPMAGSLIKNPNEIVVQLSCIPEY